MKKVALLIIAIVTLFSCEQVDKEVEPELPRYGNYTITTNDGFELEISGIDYEIEWTYENAGSFQRSRLRYIAFQNTKGIKFEHVYTFDEVNYDEAYYPYFLRRDPKMWGTFYFEWKNTEPPYTKHSDAFSIDEMRQRKDVIIGIIEGSVMRYKNELQ